MKKPILLVDGSSYFFRAFHALPPLTNSKGQPTGAIYGVANMVKRLIKDYEPYKIAVVFDAKGKTFRDEWYTDYKANRPPMPDDLSSQFEPLLEVIQAMGLPILMIEGVEADDVIGTLAREATAHHEPVLISTGDKDMAQLVSKSVTLINTMNNLHLDEQGVLDKFGVTPEQMVDYLALIGDTSDNIPGVKKCGPKTAVKWLQEYQTVEKLIENAHEIGGKVGDYLRDGIKQLQLSKKLVTIKTDVALPLSVEQLVPKMEDKEALTGLVKALEFKSWLKELLNQESVSENFNREKSDPFEFDLLTEAEQLDELCSTLENTKEFCLDTETTSLDAMCAELVGLSIKVPQKKAIYIPVAHQEDSPQLSREKVLKALKPLLEDRTIQKIGQNLKYDYTVLKNYDITLQGIAYDTMLESYILNSTASRHDMDSLALKYLGYKTISYTEIAGKGTKQLRFDEIPIHKAAPYAAEDAEVTFKLHQAIYPKMDDKIRSVFHDIEMPLLSVIAEMERHGVLIDKGTLEKHGQRLKQEITALQKEAIELAGKAFNLNSPKQLQEILFEEQNIPVIAKTPTGQPSTAESVLQQLAYDYRLPAVILQYRSLSKLVSTYIDALPKRINPETNRVHTSYNQAVTATGRLSSSDPNLQNIPIRREEGRLIRKAFIAPENHVLLAADYSQIELRIMAHLSQDESLRHAFAQGWDIHAATASEIFDVPLSEVSGDQRRSAKAVNFGLIYGMSSFGLAKQIGVSREEAQSYINRYFERYPGVKQYMTRTREQAREQGYVETVFGRRLYLPEINAQNKMRQKAAERTAINAPMQGTAADIIKKAMLAISDWQNSESETAATMIMQVHDELVFEVHEAKLSQAEQRIRTLMETTVQLSVPLDVSIGSGTDWDAAH